MADLLVRNARLVAAMDAQRTEITGGWVAVTNGFVSGVGLPGAEPPTRLAPSTPATAW